MEFFLVALFACAILMQFFLLLFLFPKVLRHKEVEKSAPRRGVSVVIAAHNERKNLTRLLPLLINQDHPDYEIVVAFDRCTDGSEGLVKTFDPLLVKTVSIEQVPEDFNPKKYALTRGIELAEKEIILLTDADCYPGSSRWISEMQQAFDPKTEIVLGFSPYEYRQGFLNSFIRYETLLTAIQYLSFGLIGKAYMGVGRNMAYLKSLFVLSNGFAEIKRLTGGDDDLFVGKNASSVNVKICISPDAKIYSIPKITWKDFFRQKIRHQAAGKKYSLKNKLKSLLFPVSGVFLYFSTILLYLINPTNSYILPIFVCRTLVLIVIFALITRKLGETTKWYLFPLLDLSYIIYYLITGITAIFSKNIKWR